MKNLGRLLLMALLFVATSCLQTLKQSDSDLWRKVELDLCQLDRDGLRGPADGKVALSYEFAIPNNESCRNRVREIDRSVRFMPDSPGRVGKAKDQCLCIGFTHQANYRDVLQKLAELAFISRIVECHFE